MYLEEDGRVVLMVCWFMVVVGFGTIVVAVVSRLGDSVVVAEKIHTVFPHIVSAETILF